jgi:uncharacterized membrane-anchored protein
MNATPLRTTALPPDDTEREALHNEVHARPTARIHLPALVIYVAVLNEGVSRADELAHLRRLPAQAHLQDDDLASNFLRLKLLQGTLKWERHTEFTRYTFTQALPQEAQISSLGSEPEMLSAVQLDLAWLAAVPGRTIAAIKLAMTVAPLADPQAVLDAAHHWFGDRSIVASLMGGGHSLAVTDFRLRDTGFERLLVVAPADTSDTRAGRIAARLLELETYRLMALRGLPVAKALAPRIGETERRLADITAGMDNRGSDQQLLEKLVELAATVERATAEHMYRFSATRAYDALVRQRIAELREKPIPGTQTIGEFMQRRLSPAIATVDSTAQRLASLSQRIERASALLRTRVDIVREEQNMELLAKLTRGQELQLRLQRTVEGLSIAAITYYVVSLVLYAAKGGKAAGFLPLQPEVLAGVAVPVTLWAVWRLAKRARRDLAQWER